MDFLFGFNLLVPLAALDTHCCTLLCLYLWDTFISTIYELLAVRIRLEMPFLPLSIRGGSCSRHLVVS